MFRTFTALSVAVLLAVAVPTQIFAADASQEADSVEPLEFGEHGFADSDGVKIHYVSAGSGPLVVMIHGFPDYWYSWREQMPALAEHFQVVAIDQRGYNQSDQPKGVENYTVDKLTADVEAVIKHLGQDKAVIVGHDWGGFVAWNFAFSRPEMTDRLVICNLPHPKGMIHELANNPEQHKNAQYARNFQKEGAHKMFSNPAGLAAMASDPDSRAAYVAAFERSDVECMLNYYKANYPREPYPTDLETPAVTCPVLMFHGLKDTALMPGGLNNTWNWLENNLTLVTIPDAGHWVQHAASDTVTDTMVWWLTK